MNKLEKELKISCIACLFVGLAVLIVGIVAGVKDGYDLDAISTIFCGLGATPAGVQAARLANVPSNSTKVRAMAIVVLIASAIFAVVAFKGGDPSVAQLVALGVMILVALIMLVFAHRQVKVLEKV